jgi:hypothetical protein
MTDTVTLIFLAGVASLWCALLWLALRQPGQGNPRKRNNDQARDS